MDIMSLEEAQGLTPEMVRAYLERKGWVHEAVMAFQIAAPDGPIVDVVRVICCGVCEDTVETFRVQDVLRRHPGARVA